MICIHCKGTEPYCGERMVECGFNCDACEYGWTFVWCHARGQKCPRCREAVQPAWFHDTGDSSLQDEIDLVEDFPEDESDSEYIDGCTCDECEAERDR